MITKKIKDAACIILDYLNDKNNQEIVTNAEFQTLLNEIIDTDIIIKVVNPDIYISYVHNSRAGIFEADGVIKLSEYIAGITCKAEFCFYDVLGKHSEINFSLEDLEYEYCDETPSLQKSKYNLSAESMKFFELNESIFIKVEKLLRKYMKTLDKINPKDFATERFDELVIYANSILSELIYTNNPTVKLTKHGKRKEIFFGGLPTSHLYIEIHTTFDIFLLLMKRNFVIENSKLDEKIPIASMDMCGIPKSIGTSEYLPNIIESDRIEILTLLKNYKPDTPAQFLIKNYEDIKIKLGIEDNEFDDT